MEGVSGSQKLWCKRTMCGKGSSFLSQSWLARCSWWVKEASVVRSIRLRQRFKTPAGVLLGKPSNPKGSDVTTAGDRRYPIHHLRSVMPAMANRRLRGRPCFSFGTSVPKPRSEAGRGDHRSVSFGRSGMERSNRMLVIISRLQRLGRDIIFE